MGRKGAYDMAVCSIYQFFERYLDDLNKKGQYSVFQTPNGVRKIYFAIENTTMTIIIQKFDYGITVIFDKSKVSN